MCWARRALEGARGAVVTPSRSNGVFSQTTSGALKFHPAPAPSDGNVAQVLATIRNRFGRLLGRRGLEPGDDAGGPADRLAEEAPLLAGFDLHATVWVAADDRSGLERLCRFALRPPSAQERLRRRGDGRVALENPRDGPRAL
jgi:hypothetical protein